MGVGKGKIEKGQGGRLGQSSKGNWVTRQEEKQDGRVRRRLETQRLERQAKEHPEDHPE